MLLAKGIGSVRSFASNIQKPVKAGRNPTGGRNDLSRNLMGTLQWGPDGRSAVDHVVLDL